MKLLTFSIHLLTILHPVHARELEGTVRVRHSGPEVYRFSRAERQDGDRRILDVWFKDLNGIPQVYEQAIYEKGRVRKYLMKQLQQREEGWVEFDGDQLHFSYTSENRTRTRSVNSDGETLIVDQLPTFVNSHWNHLMDGGRKSFQFVVLPKLSTLEFEIKKAFDQPAGGAYTVIEMRPMNKIIRLILKPSYLTFQTRPPHLFLEVQGRLPVLLMKGGRWVPFQGILAFHADSMTGNTP